LDESTRATNAQAEAGADSRHGLRRAVFFRRARSGDRDGDGGGQ
jgi:hypothetical protein